PPIARSIKREHARLQRISVAVPAAGVESRRVNWEREPSGMITSLYLTAVTTPNGALKQNLPEEEMRAAVRSGNGMLWVDLHKATPEEFFMLDEVFGFHPLAIEDCQHTSKFPKLDEFGTHVFFVFLAPNPNYR